MWCPDWPVVALRRAERAPAGEPVVVMGEGGRVRAASSDARARGVRRGLRKREAQARCPEAAVIDADPTIEAGQFEDVARALESVTHRMALDRPGLLSFPLRGPTRVFGGEQQVAEAVVAAVPLARVGVASGRFAAELVARHTTEAEPVHLLDAGATAGFLADRPVGVLRERGAGELAGLFARLGLRTLGAVAALPESSVAARFGAEGLRVHCLARGLDDGPLGLAAPPPETVQSAELDPPVDRVDTAVFAARSLAAALVDDLGRRGLACTAVTVEAQTEHGERLTRLWRMAEAGTEAALVQRVRWQLDAWLSGRAPVAGEAGDEPAPDEDATGGLVLIRLVPEEVAPRPARQLDFFGGDAHAADRAANVLARLQGMLGHEAVAHPVVVGGRTPAERTGWVPFGDPLPRSTAPDRSAPWPGAVPAPAPALAFDPPSPADLLDAGGRPVEVSGRGELSAPPVRLACAAVGVDGPVEHWAGPWPHDVRFWDPVTRRRRALFQVVTGGRAFLVSVSRGRAGLEALYD